MAYALVNGLNLYYEIHGAGEPLVLIPGGLMTIDMMGAIVPGLTEYRQVIALEPQAHGHTADIDRPLTYESMADDVAELIVVLGLRQADVVGFSVGAGVALQTAIRHPGRVRKLVFISGTYTGDGEHPQIRSFEASFAPEMPMLTHNRDAYMQAAGNAAGWPALVTKMRRLLATEYDWSSQVATIQAPTLVVAADADTMPVAHAVQLFTLLGGGNVEAALGQPGPAQLAVMPGTTHFSILSNAAVLDPLIRRFLDDSGGTASS